MTDAFQMTLSPTRSEVARARRFVTMVAHEIGQEQLSDVVELLTSELVTNAILHSGDEPFQIAVRWSPAQGPCRRSRCPPALNVG